jgi:hypothetical protein
MQRILKDILKPIIDAVMSSTPATDESLPDASDLFQSITINTGTTQQRGTPIPRRRTPSVPQQKKPASQRRPSHTKRRSPDMIPPGFQVGIAYSRRDIDFIKQAKKYAKLTARKTQPVPFMCYYPTYDDMSKAQARWYFYWRTQIRQGNPLPADTSYLFVYVYEVLNLIGFSSPDAAFKHLGKFWLHYRILHPKLDNYLVDWIADFLAVYKLSITPLEWYGRILTRGAFSKEIDLSIEGWLATGGDFLKLPGASLYRLAGYNPTRSKFFKEHGEEYQLEALYRQGLQAVEDSLRASGSSIFKVYRPKQARTIKREPFYGALHGFPHQAFTVAKVRPWSSQETLSGALTSIIKYTENIKRGQVGVKSKLRGIVLPEAWQAVLDETFVLVEPRREISIDMARVAQLNQESEAVRERLTVDDADLVEPAMVEIPQPIPSSGLSIDMDAVARVHDESEVVRERLTVDDLLDDVPQSPNGGQTDALELTPIQPPPGTPAGQLTELAEIAAIMAAVGQAAVNILDFLKGQDWEAAPGSVPSDLFAGSFLSAELDALNERAVDILGDALIFEEGDLLVVSEDYRDELEFLLANPEYVTRTTDDSVISDDIYNNLDDDWAAFARKLDLPHWAILAVLYAGQSEQVQLDDIARSVYSTSSQLLDRINELADDTIGDIVIDTMTDPPQIVEEYGADIKALLRWAGQRELLIAPIEG